MPGAPSGSTEALQAIARSLELLLRLQVQAIKGERNQTEMIHLLDALGFRPVEIAGALGATTGTVNTILSRLRGGSGKGR